jgi:hypothetical protein
LLRIFPDKPPLRLGASLLAYDILQGLCPLTPQLSWASNLVFLKGGFIVKKVNFDQKIFARVTLEEKERIESQARQAGLTVSALVRKKMLGIKVIANVDSEMIRELRRVGGLLKHIHNESDGSYSSETRKGLDSINILLEKYAK